MLSDDGHNVIIGADNHPYSFLENAFPDLELIRFPGFQVHYGPGPSMVMMMLWQLPKFLKGIRREHHMVERIVLEKKIDIVISDNRFGLWTKKARTIYLTHQLMISTPKGLKFIEPVLHWFHSRIIRRYNACWVPDVAGSPNLSGDLSHKYALDSDTYFTGPLSRFFRPEVEQVKEQSAEGSIVGLISGPEPQRTIFEDKVRSILASSSKHGILLRGLPGDKEKPVTNKKLEVYNHLPDSMLEDVIRSATLVISRPGYSTIMDLVALKKTALLVPTPGQTEQEYLAHYHNSLGTFSCVNQEQLDNESISDVILNQLELSDLFDLTLLRENWINFLSRYDN
jgi:UDP-N-acetylglucosamine transferase subunit ALG13